jgi:hypothetical protein
MIVTKGATSQTVYVDLLDNASTSGGRKTGLSSASAGMTAYYVRAGGSAVAISLSTLAAANSAWSSGGMKEVDGTNMPGVYRYDIPDAAFASGADSVVITIKATGVVQVTLLVKLTAVDFQDAVRAGLTALPNATAGATNGLPLAVDSSGRVDVLKINGTSQTARDIGASVLLSAGSGAGQLDFTSGVIKANLAQILGTALTETAGQIAAAFKAFFNVAAPVLTTASVNQTGDAYARLGAPAGASIAADVAAIKSLATVRSNTAQAGASGSITLDASASATNDLYKGQWIYITSGTGAGQSRLCTGYVGSTKVASVAPNWATNPDNTSVFNIWPSAGIDVEMWLAATAPANTGDAYARIGAAGVGLTNLGDTRIAHLDADVSSRSTYAGADTSGTTTLLSRIGSALTITGGKVDVNDKTGFSLSSAGVQAIWDALTSALTTVNSIGKLLVTNIDAAISSRLASGSYSAPPSAASIRAEMDSNSTKLANLDATVSSRLATSGYTAPDNADILLIKAKTDNLPASPAAVSDIPTASTNASTLLDFTNGVEGSLTVRQFFRLASAALFGKASGLATTTATYRNPGDTKNRIVATVDGDGNRSAISLDAS